MKAATLLPQGFPRPPLGYAAKLGIEYLIIRDGIVVSGCAIGSIQFVETHVDKKIAAAWGNQGDTPAALHTPARQRLQRHLELLDRLTSRCLGQNYSTRKRVGAELFGSTNEHSRPGSTIPLQVRRGRHPVLPGSAKESMLQPTQRFNIKQHHRKVMGGIMSSLHAR